MRLNRLNLHKTSKEQEEAYRKFYLPANINQAKWGLTFFFLPIVLFLINDYIIFGVSLQLAALATIRIIMITTAILAIIKINKTVNPVTYDQIIFFVSAVMLFFGGILHFFRPENFLAHAIVTSVSVFVVYLVIPFRYQYQCLLGTAATIGESAIVLYNAAPINSVTFTIVFSLLFSNLVAAISSWKLNLYRRNAFNEYQKRVKAQEDLEKSNQNLEALVAEKTLKLKKTERLAAIGSTAAMVGHDLRNPLTAISGAAYYLKKNYGEQLDSKANGMVDLIQNNVKYSDKIINDLLDYSREIHLETTKTSLEDITQEALTIVNIPPNIQVNHQKTASSEVVVDAVKMQRVFINLIKNAVDAMPDGGLLEIKTEPFEREVRIAFIDTGSGISLENQKSLFQPLFTTKAKGMGFGLAICQRIVEAHNGKITIQSIINTGTTVTVKLPTKK